MISDFRLKCGTRLSIADLETAGISYVPCGTVDGSDQPLLRFAHLWGNRRQVTLASFGKKASAWQLSKTTGVQVMTGYPTFRQAQDSPDGSVYLTDIDIEKLLIDTHPAVFDRIVEVYRDACDCTPCIIATKSGGRRLSAFAAYLDSKREFKDASDNMLLEIFSIKGLSRLDHRYAFLEGSILNIPEIPKSALQEIHAIISEVAIEKKHENRDYRVVESSQIGDLEIHWNTNGKSQYFPAARCQVTSHKNSEHPTVVFQKIRDGVQGHCFNCGKSWWEIEPTCENTVEDLIKKAPPIETRESSSFPHFSQEARVVVNEVLKISPDAGWHGQAPVFTTRYEYLYPLTQKFKLNGQPSEVEKRRVWTTLFGSCEICGAVTARWVDRYLLTAGLYCDGCHKDYHLGSYLELELVRKLPNSIMSEYQGFLGDDPEFADFRLWEPGTFTHLGAAMSTGKTTEIDKQMSELASQGLGKGIIAVPRISLARFLAHYLREKHGYRSWGLWHEGCLKTDRFIGAIGAIVCLPSLPLAVKSATKAGVSQFYIAIDEVDFGYNLLSLSMEQATAVKKCLRDTLASTGLVVSGQTESTLALEALAEELECEQVQGFYNTAKPANGNVVMHKYPNIEGKSSAILCGVMDDISNYLSAGHNVYAFCATRRGGDLIADIFQNENPVIYNAYTKGNERADAVLRNQRLTDSRLFIATSAAGVGISILDPNARTVVASGLVYGSRDASMSVQELVRDRGRCGGAYHYSDYNLPLPLRPAENEKVSIYHETLKQAASRYAHLPSAGIRKIAHAQALASLADIQIEAFISYHLQTVGNMPVYQASALEHEPGRIAAISSRRTEIRRAEREKRIRDAVQLLNQRDILTTSEIRVLSNKGKLSPEGRLAHETANAVAQAVGWEDKFNLFNSSAPARDVLNNDDLDVATRLAEENINADKLAKQRRGYLAVKFPKWIAHLFQTDLEKSESDLVNDGLGVEITAIHDDRFLGEILTVLLKRLVGKMFDSVSLAMELREVLQTTCSNGKTFESEIESGALGAGAYRKARFLHCADDVGVVKWGRAFVAEWYPAYIAKSGEAYGLRPNHKWNLYRDSFLRWLMHQPGIPDIAHVTLDTFQPTELPNPNIELKAEARKERRNGATLTEISEKIGVNISTISRWCRDIPKLKPQAEVILEEKVLELRAQQMSIRKITKTLNVSRGKVERILKNNKVS